MPISPNVSAYMTGDEQQQQAVQSADQIFVQQFTEQAYNTMRAKFPALLNHIVTLKVLTSNMEDSSAFAVFIVQSGDRLVYIPITLSGGVITSCEMGYDKEEDQFFPLTETTIRTLIAANKFSEPTILQNNPYVEDTRQLFRNMVRPPSSSNVVLASDREGISGLSNENKQLLSDYLTRENPQLLAKIASFYGVDEFAHKIAQKPVQEKVVEAALPSFLRLDTLTKEAAAALKEDERQEILQYGYLIKSAESDGALHVSPVDSFSKKIEDELHLEIYCPFDQMHHYHRGNVPSVGSKELEPLSVETAKLVSADQRGVQFTPVLLCGSHIIGREGKLNLYSEPGADRVVVSERSQDDNMMDIIRNLYSNEVFPISSLQSKVAGIGKHECPSLGLLLPTRTGRVLYTDAPFGLPVRNDIRINKVDDQTYISTGEPVRIVVSPAIEYGCLRMDNVLMVPMETRAILIGGSEDERDNPLPAVRSFDAIRKIVSMFGTMLSTVDNGAGTSITDSVTQKTASFRTNADAAAWLHDTYGMNGTQVRTVLSTPKSIVFTKRAFVDPEEFPTQQSLEERMNGIPTETAGSGEIEYDHDAMPQPAKFDPSMLNDFAQMEDPEIMDAGVLSAFAEDPDIKSLLVDYLPDFLSAQDRVGRILLLFSYQKKNMEDFYGTEKYSSVLNSCRKVFNILGKIVDQLKIYINMV